MQTKLQLYTVPGQVYLNSTRKLVLQGVDGLIFVADSSPEKFTENIESYNNLIENLEGYGKDLADLPHVIQYNKRDVPNALPVDNMDRAMNRFGRADSRGSGEHRRRCLPDPARAGDPGCSSGSTRRWRHSSATTG